MRQESLRREKCNEERAFHLQPSKRDTWTFGKFRRIVWFGEYILFTFFGNQYSPFRLTSLIYAEKFELENPAIMEDKQCKQTERFSVMTKGRYYFLS